MTVTNAAQTEQWNGPTGDFWARHAERYERTLGVLTPHLIRGAALGAGDRVLDVGCGCGATTRRAAEQAASAHGVDLSAPMLAEARRAADGMRNVTFAQADAQVDRLDPADVAISRLGVMFFEDPLAAFTNLRRTAARLAFVCWAALSDNEHRMMERAALAPHVPMPAPRTDGGPGAFSLADPDRTRKLLRNAGFTTVELEEIREPLTLGSTAAEATGFKLSDPTVQGWFTEAGPEAAARATEALHRAYQEHETRSGVQFDSTVWLVTAN